MSYDISKDDLNSLKDWKISEDDNKNKCDCCGGVLGEFSENGTCFDCILYAGTPGNYSQY